MNYYERHIGDYLKDTAHLSLLEHGIYGRLLDIYYTREEAIPESQLMRLVGARTDEERSAVRDVVTEFFVTDGVLWLHKRCESEISRYREKQRKAKASADARWSHTERNANAMRTHTERIAGAVQTQSEGNALHTPDTSNQTPEKKRSAPLCVAVSVLVDAGFSPDVAGEFIAHKSRLKAPLTARAWADHLSEATKAGWTPQQAAEKVMAKAWKGFEAKYVASEVAASKVLSFYAQDAAQKKAVTNAWMGSCAPRKDDFIDMEAGNARIELG